MKIKQNMNTKIALSGLSIFAALALVGGATFAFFSDSGTSSGNTFATGSMDLKLANGVGSYSDSVSATWGDTGLTPGSTTTIGTLNLKNAAGSIPANHVDIAFVNTNSDLLNPLDTVMRVTTLTYDGNDLLAGLGTVPNVYGLVDTDASGFLELDELATQGLDNHTLALLALIDVDVPHPFIMQLTMDPNAGNEYQGDNVSTALTVTLQQDSGQ